MTCKDCIHYSVCKDTWSDDNWNDEVPKEIKEMFSPKGCENFKNKVDFAEVKHGEWIDVYMSSPSSFVGTCSMCRATNDIPPPTLANYCPHCGAKMDGVKKEEKNK